MSKTSILFVCMGNICRSPTAEGVFRVRAERAGIASKLHIDSAGTHAYHVGHQPDPRATDSAARRGYDLSTQHARQVQARDFTTFDRIYAMDHDNLARLKAGCPQEHQHKLGLFMQLASNTASDVVPDPYYGDGSGFELVLDYIEDASDGLLADLSLAFASTKVRISKNGFHTLGRELATFDELAAVLVDAGISAVDVEWDAEAGYEGVGKLIFVCMRLGINVGKVQGP